MIQNPKVLLLWNCHSRSKWGAVTIDKIKMIMLLKLISDQQAVNCKQMIRTVFSFFPLEIKLTPKGKIIQIMITSISKSISYSVRMVRFVLRKRQPTPVFLAWRIPGTGQPMGRRLWGLTELDTTEVTYGEGSGTPLQYSCLENPMDGGAW